MNISVVLLCLILRMNDAAAVTAAPIQDTVAVFGASWAQPGDALYIESQRCGAAIARAGYHLINGGYSGTMTGSAEGHRNECVSSAAADASPPDGAGASPPAPLTRTGVLVPSLFPSRYSGGNAALSMAVDAPTLIARIDAMLGPRVAAVVVLKGTLGTLTELCCAWNVAHLQALEGLPRLRVYAYEEPWRAIVAAAGASLGLDGHVARIIEFVKDTDDAMRLLKAAQAENAAAPPVPQPCVDADE